MAVIYIECHLADHLDLTSTLPIEDLQPPEKKYIYFYKILNYIYFYKILNYQ